MSKSLSPFWSAFEVDGSFSQQLLVEFADTGLAQSLHEDDLLRHAVTGHTTKLVEYCYLRQMQLFLTSETHGIVWDDRTKLVRSAHNVSKLPKSIVASMG